MFPVGLCIGVVHDQMNRDVESIGLCIIPFFFFLNFVLALWNDLIACSVGFKRVLLSAYTVTLLYSLFVWCQLRPREKEAINYAEKLKDKFAHHPEVRRIKRHRHVPKAIYSAQKELRIIRTSQKKKYVNCSLFINLLFWYIFDVCNCKYFTRVV